MFVGDSLNRNQWESMVCFVQSAVPSSRKSLIKSGSLNIFRIEVIFLSPTITLNTVTMSEFIYFLRNKKNAINIYFIPSYCVMERVII